MLDDILGEDFALLCYAADPRAGLDAQSLATLSALRTRFVALYPYGGRPQGERRMAAATSSGLVEVEDLSGESVAWFRQAGAKPGSVALIRPDKFVYTMARTSEAADIVTHALGAMKVDRAPAPEIRPMIPA